MTPRASRWPVVLGLGAGALTAAGVALTFSGHAQQDAADHACPMIGQPACDSTKAQALNDSAVLRSRVGVGMLVGGVVVAEAALYLWWRSRDQRRERPPLDAGIVVAPGGGMITYQGSFR